jgi:quinol monooxygenase YgiN
MIHVVAQINLKRGTAPLFLREFRDLAILVRQEPGCVDYFPAQDVDMGLQNQPLDPDRVTVLEKWTSRRALESHLRSGHMRGFQDRIKDIVVDMNLAIVEEV